MFYTIFFIHKINFLLITEIIEISNLWDKDKLNKDEPNNKLNNAEIEKNNKNVYAWWFCLH